MEHARHSQLVLMQIKIKLLVNQTHHANGLHHLQELNVPHTHVQHMPQVQTVNQFQALIELHIQFVFFKMEPVKLLILEP